MKRFIFLMVCAMVMFSVCSCFRQQPTSMRQTVSHCTAVRLEKRGSAHAVLVTGEVSSLYTLDSLALAVPEQEVPLLGEWIYRMTFDPADIVKGGSEIIVQFGENCLSIDDKIYVAEDGTDYADILAWAESKYVSFIKS